MKTLCLLLSFFFLAFVGCNKVKQQTNTSQHHSGSIIGIWELRVLHGGMLASPHGNYYPPGNGHRWKFTDSLYEQYADGKLVMSGKYSLSKDTCPATGTYMDAFKLEQNSSYKTFFEFSSDTLVLYNGVIAADGTISKYVIIEDK
jgi:hypothetical protein